MEPTIKVIAMPENTNPDGDVFGGWILSMMDLAGAVVARREASRQVVTVAIDNMKFHKPVFVGDFLECFAAVEKIGRTSLTVKVRAQVERRMTRTREEVTEGTFIFVAIDKDRQPVPVPIKGL